MEQASEINWLHIKYIDWSRTYILKESIETRWACQWEEIEEGEREREGGGGLQLAILAPQNFRFMLDDWQVDQRQCYQQTNESTDTGTRDFWVRQGTFSRQFRHSHSPIKMEQHTESKSPVITRTNNSIIQCMWTFWYYRGWSHRNMHPSHTRFPTPSPKEMVIIPMQWVSLVNGWPLQGVLFVPRVAPSLRVATLNERIQGCL